MKTYKELVSDFKDQLRQAVCVGPLSGLEERLNKVFYDFESEMTDFIQEEIAKEINSYLNRVEGIPDGEPIFYKDKAIDEDQT